MDRQAESEESSSGVSDQEMTGGPITLRIKEEPECNTEYDAVGQGFMLAVSVKEEAFDSDGFARLEEPHTPPGDWCVQSALVVKGDTTAMSRGGTLKDDVTAAHCVSENPDTSLDVPCDASLTRAEDSHERLTNHKSATHDCGDDSAGIDEENSDLADEGWMEKPPTRQESLQHVSGVRNFKETGDLFVHQENYAGISGMSALRRNECDVGHKCLSTPKALKMPPKAEKVCPTCEEKNPNARKKCKGCGSDLVQSKKVVKEDFRSQSSSTEIKNLLEKRAHQLWANHNYHVVVLYFADQPKRKRCSSFATPGKAEVFQEGVQNTFIRTYEKFMRKDVAELDNGEEEGEKDCGVDGLEGEEERQGEEGNGSSGLGAGSHSRHPGPSKNRDKTRKRRKQKRGHDSVREGDLDWFCDICKGPWSQSCPGEEWVQCTQCKQWSHVKCTSILNLAYYVCHKCH